MLVKEQMFASLVRVHRDAHASMCVLSSCASESEQIVTSLANHVAD